MARILIVDGHDQARWTLANLLRSEGHQVDQAADGLQALEHLAAHPCDVVLMDVYLPRMNGLEACRKLRQESHVPILITSTNRDPSLREQAMSSGANAYLCKPMELEGLLAWVQVILLGRAGTSRLAPACCPNWN